MEEAEILYERALAFLRNAKRLIEEEEWDLAAFSLEQYCQLALKYKLLILTGSYPRTHSLRRLIKELGKHTPQVLKLVDDRTNLIFVARLEEAYISSRYLPYRYERVEVEELYKFVIEVFKPAIEEIQI